MYKQLLVNAKKYNFLQKLEINSYVDAIDQSRWKIGKIVGFKNVGHRHTIRLHFDGYPTQWDQDFDLPASHKLAPFRRFTLPYTGPTASDRTIYRPPASLNFQTPYLMLKKLNKEDKQKLKPEWIIQMYRGELFILVDTLLTQNIKIKPQQCQQVLKFLEAYIEVGVNILQYALDKINQVSKQNINDPNVIYISVVYALLSSVPEILFNFNSMVSFKQKRVKFFNQFQNSQIPRKKIKTAMLNKNIVKICKSILEYQNLPFRGFPWTAKKQVLILLSGLEQVIQFPKIVDTRQMSQALDVLSYLKLKQAFQQITIETIHIDLVCSHITNGNFEGKLKGLAQLKKFCEGIIPVKRQVLKQKILSPGILNSLTDNSTFNGQIFKRSLPIFQAAAKYDLLSDQLLKRIISLHRDKHELQLKSFCTALAEFGSILNQKKTVQFFEQIKQFPISVNTINLVKNFTLNVINLHPSFKRKFMQPSTGFGITYLWKLIKQQQNSTDITNSAIEAFSSLAGNYYYRQAIEKYLMQSFESIKQGRNVQNSLKIIHCCLNKNKQLTNLIDNIDRQYNLIDTVIKSMIQAPKISTKTIQSVFQFLQQVNQFTRKKITVQHIKQLWNIKQCQKSLLKFMKKYNTSRGGEKSTDKIVNKKLDPIQIKEIIVKIFMNKPLMDNYTKIDQQAYRTIDELLVSYNHRAKNIDYNFKHTIRCLNIQGLFGLELYIDIALKCKDQEISRHSLRRFIQYYLRPYSSKQNNQYSKNEKIQMWKFCADKITKLMQDSPKINTAYAILFEQIKGRMISINILDQSQISFTVLAKASNIRKQLTVRRCFSLWKLRQIINQAFKLNNTNFQIFIPSKDCITDMERQEDFSNAFIETPREPSTVCVVITETKQAHPHFVAIQDFKLNFSLAYAEKIYDSLGNIKQPDNQILALNVLLSMPTIKSLEARLSKLEINKQFSWQHFLDSQCRPRLCYQLSMLNKVKSLGIPWITSFIKKGGVQHIQKIVRQRNASKVVLTNNDYQFLSKLLQFFNQTIQFYKLSEPNLPFNEVSVIQFIKVSSKQRNSPMATQRSFLQYFYLMFNTLKQIVNYPNINGQKILTNQSTLMTLQMLLFTPKKLQIQQRFPKTVIEIFVKCKCDRLLSNFMQQLLNNLLTTSPKQNHCCRVYFNLLVIMFDLNIVTNELYESVLNFIKQIRYGNNQMFYENQNQTNEMICGWLRISKCLILKSITTKNQLKSIPQTQQKFAEFLIREGLFKEGHKFESQSCRKQAYEILSIMNCTKQIMTVVGKELVPMMLKGSWRKQNQWFIKSFHLRQKNTKVGIKNLAATCYINSLIQQLFNIQQFRERLLALDVRSLDISQNIAYQVQKIFAYLKYSNKQIYSTESLCENFILQGQPIDPRVQMDADEFFHTLMDKVQFNLKKINQENIINDIFQGEYSNLIIGQECQHKSERIQNFMSMRLEIKNKSSLQQALTEFIKGEVLEGQNAYFCQKCDKKIKAVKRVCVKSLPDILILTLKRFQFDFDKMQKFKLNTYCEFSQDLDMEPYMRQSLYQNQEKLQTDSYKYKLKGVIIHYGISEAGHYTSYIRVQNGEWKYFDDDKISNFNVKQLGNESFGGVDDNPYSDNSEKIKNAYVLIYQKKKKNNLQPLTTHQSIKGEVDTENLNNQQIKILFDPGLQQFFNENFQALNKNYLLYTHLVTLRSELRSKYLLKSYENCVSLFESQPSLAEWYLEQFNQSMIKQFLIYGFMEVGYFVASLLIYCVNRHFNPNFIKRCMKCLDKKNMICLIKIFAAAALQTSYFKVLSEYNFHQRVYKIIKQDKCANPTSLSKLEISRSEFGQPNIQFYDKKDFRNSIEFIQCIQTFKFKNLNFEDIELLYKRAKKLSTQVGLANFLAPKFKEEDQNKSMTTGFLMPILTKFQLKMEDQYIFKFCLILISKFCEIKDQQSKRRISRMAETYFIAIKQSLQGYKPMRLLLEGLFSLSFNNQLFHEEIIALFNQKDNKKYIKAVRDWMKQSDKFLLQVKNDRLGYWRRSSRTNYAHLQKIQSDKKVLPDTYLSLFNSLLQKHKIQFTDLYSPQIKIGQIISLNDLEQYEYQVISKVGLMLQIKNNEGNIRFVLQSDAFPLRSI